jgi:hypothetical protein
MQPQNAVLRCLSLGLDEMFSLNAKNPVHFVAGPTLRELVPGGMLSNFDNRWAWIDHGGKGVLQLWLGTSSKLQDLTWAAVRRSILQI